MIKKIGLTFTALLLTSMANAGFDGLTHHSRANCNNESISWNWLRNETVWVISYHYISADSRVPQHIMDEGYKTTWRNAEVHWLEGMHGGWEVNGFHYMKVEGRNKLVKDEYVKDCSIYDGWWEKNKLTVRK